MSRDVACRVSISATMYKIFNINGLSNLIVEGVSKIERRAATQPFLASFIILIHPLQPGCLNYKIPQKGVIDWLLRENYRGAAVF